MDTNCLITKLKGSVNNSELYKLNELRYFVPAGNNLRLDAAYRVLSEPLSFTPISGSLICNDVTYNVGDTLTISGNSGYNITTPNDADAIWSISNKNAFKCIYFNSGERVSPISGKHRALLNYDFGYLTNLESIEGYMQYPNVVSFGKFPKLKNLGTGNYYQLFVNKSILNYLTPENFPLIEEINLTGFRYSYDIKELASLITLKIIQAKGSSTVGSIEVFADAMLTAGRTDGYINIATDRNITYQGQVWENRTFKITYSNGSYNIE